MRQREHGGLPRCAPSFVEDCHWTFESNFVHSYRRLHAVRTASGELQPQPQCDTDEFQDPSAAGTVSSFQLFGAVVRSKALQKYTDVVCHFLYDGQSAWMDLDSVWSLPQETWTSSWAVVACETLSCSAVGNNSRINHHKCGYLPTM